MSGIVVQFKSGGEGMKTKQNNIRKIIEEKDLKIIDVIKEIGVAKSYFYDVMNGTSVPSLPVARKISEVLEEDLDYVFPKRRF